MHRSRERQQKDRVPETSHRTEDRRDNRASSSRHKKSAVTFVDPPRGRSPTPRLSRGTPTPSSTKAALSSKAALVEKAPPTRHTVPPRTPQRKLRPVHGVPVETDNSDGLGKDRSRSHSSGVDSFDFDNDPYDIFDLDMDDLSIRNDSPEVDELQTSGLLVNPWIDGNVTKTFTRAQLGIAETDKTTFNLFAMHWAFRNRGGNHDKGTVESAVAESGHLTKRTCLGLFRCPNWNREGRPCKYVVRPKTKPHAFRGQRNEVCPMGNCKKAPLEHVPCHVSQHIRVFKDGATFRNIGHHTHGRPSVVPHLTPTERKDARAVMESNPKLGPSALRTGRPDMVGPTPNLRSITPVLGNRGRIAYERKLMKDGGKKGRGMLEHAVEKIKQITERYPGVIREASLAPGPVYFTLQTDFMAEMSLHMDFDYTRPNNGLITDAAMKYFKDDMFTVIITSGYSTRMLKWAPVLITVVGGQDTEHYERHFDHLVASIADRCAELGIEFNDEMLSMV